MAELQARMPFEEFVMWKAYLRRCPRGLAWDNWVQARLCQQVDALIPRAKGKRLPKFKDFVWNPPEPLFVLAAEERAQRELDLKVKTDE